MQKSITALIVALLAVAMFPARLMATVIPPTGLPPGSQYQLVFVTAGSTIATSSDIADYNAFVTSEAALTPSLPSGVAWHAFGSTFAVAADINAPSGGLPIYNTAASK